MKAQLAKDDSQKQRH